MIPVTEEMRRVYTLLAEEVSRWPEVTTRLMFGLRAVYREGVVFAMLPDKRSLEVANSIAYKEGGSWKSYEMGDVGGALEVLGRAYEGVG
jgi:hypothetical protein